ncbi:CCA tRNA nucleotidyltransferase [Staphylococcus sp. 17KM0847]|uniref:CCA tRNA nucleotidyltransferase n=1 Tax=Staphylococcus sp. 17KM0847 TaxID=2583989 RepID=UPI0015DC6D3E|nr:CCA tRNA nucleotidyltransferase [Staphylococcus sp. 17KM0847]QLK86154.1 CCA tRNA nucleotidyltransferase [Staphylococcus sp. 17KM0847]
MNNKIIFLDALPIMQRLMDNGYDAYFVGGAVRDYIMHRPINDVDITTSATPNEIESLFDHTIPVGKEHGTINVVWQGSNYEVTTFRTDGAYLDHRRPSEVFFVRDLYRDVERRDFTINAIAMDHQFQLVDYFEGQQDIQAQIIRTVGHPKDRFDEDALRILRGLRFQSQLGFTIARDTYHAMKENVADIEYLAIERIMIELEKLLHGSHVSQVFASLSDLNIWHYLPYFREVDMRAIRINIPLTLSQFLAIVMYCTHHETGLKQLKRSNDEIKAAQHLVHALKAAQQLDSKRSLAQFVYDFGYHTARELLALQDIFEVNNITQPTPIIFNLQIIEEVFQSLVITNRTQLDINGKTLMTALASKPGPWLKTALRSAECAVVQRKIPNREQEIIEWVKTNVKIP